MTDGQFEGTFQPDGDYDEGDIFATAPKAIDWNDYSKGEVFEFHVLSTPELVQQWDAKGKKPATWDDSGNPKMAAVIRVESQGEERSLWATKPSLLFRMLQEASRAVKTSIRPGGTITGRYGGRGKAERGMSAPHLYEDVVYIPES